MNVLPEWHLPSMLRSPLFAPLYPLLARLDAGQFPTLQDCNFLLAECQPPVRVKSGLPLRFVAQAHGKLPVEAQYEPRCYLNGEVQTRERNWHDLFNALVWLTFPSSKAVINARHYHCLLDRQAAPDIQDAARNQRGKERDMLTLLDESGVLVVCADAELDRLLRNFQWKELFWQRRERVNTSMGFYLFGHGLYEKALRPYIGFTGQGLLLAVEQKFFTWPMARQLAHLDWLLASYLNVPEHCRSTRELTPVPLLGIPGWSPENESLSYYENNTGYFRAGRLTFTVNE